MIPLFNINKLEPSKTLPRWHIINLTDGFIQIKNVSAVLKVKMFIFLKNTLLFTKISSEIVIFTRNKLHFHDLKSSIMDLEWGICTTWEMCVFGVTLVRILSHSDWIRTRRTSNTDTFYAAMFWMKTLSGFWNDFSSYLIKQLPWINLTLPLCLLEAALESCRRLKDLNRKIYPSYIIGEMQKKLQSYWIIEEFGWGTVAYFWYQWTKECSTSQARGITKP